MAKVELSDLANIFTAAATINANMDRIEDAMENTLSRDGTAPNEMNAVLDMNNNRIINVPAPEFATDVVRLVDLTSADLDLGLSASDIENDSIVPGETVKDALENIVVGNLSDSDGIENASTVVGASVSDALDTLQDAVDNFDTDILDDIATFIDGRNIHPDTDIPADIVVSVYDPSGTEGMANHAIESFNTSTLAGKERYTLFVGNYDDGTYDGTVPASTYALGVSMIKDNWPSTAVKGQAHGLGIVHRSGFHGVDDEPGSGNPGDSAAIVTNGVTSHPNNFCAVLEGASHYAPGGAFVPDTVQAVRVQIGVVAPTDGVAHGFIASATAGALKNAFQATNVIGGAYGDGFWENAFCYIPDLGDGFYEAMKINQAGWLMMNNGPVAGVPNQWTTIRAAGGGGMDWLNHAQTDVIANLSNIGVFRVAKGIKLAPTTAPTAEQGMIYQSSSTGKMMFCEDGVNYRTVTTT